MWLADISWAPKTIRSDDTCTGTPLCLYWRASCGTRKNERTNACSQYGFIWKLLEQWILFLRLLLLLVLVFRDVDNGVFCFSANTTGSFNRRCLSCEFSCGFVSGSFSPTASYFLLNCKGQRDFHERKSLFHQQMIHSPLLNPPPIWELTESFAGWMLNRS